jgi:glycine cleavage system transcriptional repressor
MVSTTEFHDDHGPCHHVSRDAIPSSTSTINQQSHQRSYTSMGKQMVMSVMSKDRPGIVADITGVIYQLNGDLADLNQSVLCDYFSMILIATFDDAVTPEDVVAGFSHIPSATKLEVVVKEVEASPANTSDVRGREIYVLTAQGRNKSGLVHRIGLFCCQHGINILDLATTLSGDLYTMILQLDLSRVESVDIIRVDLARCAEESGLHVVLQHEDLFKATSEITLL